MLEKEKWWLSEKVLEEWEQALIEYKSQAQGWGTWPNEYRNLLVVLIRHQLCGQCCRAHRLGHYAL